MSKTADVVVLDGRSLTTECLYKLGRLEMKVDISEEAWKRVAAAREVVDKAVANSAERKVKIYGVTTGFGRNAPHYIGEKHLKQLQTSIIVSHATGVGQPLTPERTRMLMALRINVLCTGNSGVSRRVLQAYVDAFNESCLPIVPEKGTVGASGDLAPLAHIALGLIGKGDMWSPSTGRESAKKVLEQHNLKPLEQDELKPKDGLTLVNGAQLITSLGCEAVERAALISKQADVIAALTVQVLRGSADPYKEEIHNARRHTGQNQSAGRMRQLLDFKRFPDENLLRRPGDDDAEVQDPYSMRCVPQVHGVACDTTEMVRKWLNTELNSATDNPIVVGGEILVGGNFHGEYPAKALDYLAIGVHELASISERRLDKLMHGKDEGKDCKRILPPFLVNPDPVDGLNSGFMIVHCTAASLVSENKGLCHPASVDTIPTSDGQEDHVSMGGWSARKALQVVENVETVLSLELLAACQGMYLREKNQLKLKLDQPKLTTPLQDVYKLVLEYVKLDEKDIYMGCNIEAVGRLVREGKIWEKVRGYLTED
ncbi:histidine ammonia-lyase-like [Corticium candelabrum]|uniref:histidine ammonia-lyase-like n=1 Tax=Corticium candelabrum TaxID=121492 RepID=UPI002E274870|nr:histidine ammonia-lyase-like [Corticium candelabrum]